MVLLGGRWAENWKLVEEDEVERENMVINGWHWEAFCGGVKT